MHHGERLHAVLLAALLGAATALAAGCAALPVIPGTHVSDTRLNRQIIDVCERYRHALEDRDATALLQLASPLYFEDSGTPKAEDDYGYEGLKQVINTRLAALKNVRYNITYREVRVTNDPPVKGSRAGVEIRYDASYQIATELGDRWERKQNDKRLDLEYDGQQWRFTSGM